MNKQDQWKRQLEEEDFKTFYFERTQMENLPSNVLLEEGEYSIGQFVFKIDQENQLGRGGFSKVYRGQSILNKELKAAIKITLVKQSRIQICKQQAYLQDTLKSQQVIKIYCCKLMKIDHDLLFVMALQLAEGGQFKVPKEGFSVEKAIEKLKDVMKAYRIFYEKGIIHCDIKPNSILITKEDKLKFSGFSAAAGKMIGESNRCTREYASPQQMKLQQFTNKCDAYALGCLFFQFLIGQNPKWAGCTKSFNRMDMDKIKGKLEEKNIKDKDIHNFLEGCLREKEYVEKTLQNGQKVEDTARSRFSWEDVYLHPLFKGQLNYIALEVEGKRILLKIKTMAASQSVKIIQLLEEYQHKKSTKIANKDLFKMLRDKKIYISQGDINMLSRILRHDQTIDIKQLIKQINKIDKIDDFSFTNHRLENLNFFAKLFNTPQGQNYVKWHKKYKEWQTTLEDIEKYKQQEKIYLVQVKMVLFPPLPPTDNLRSVTIKHGLIDALEARLNAPNLDKLQLVNCQISRIVTIRGCPNLTNLNLSLNRIRQIEGMQLIPKLKHLDLGYNRIGSINNVGHLKHLTQLILDSNKIVVLEGFFGCSSLEKLWLQNNKIRKLNGLFGLNPEAPLKEIKLPGNLIIGSGENKQDLQKLKKQYKKVDIFINGQNEEQFQEVFPLKSMEDGDYIIVPYKYMTTSVRITNDQDNLKILTLMKKQNDPVQKFWIRMQENDDHSIFQKQQNGQIRDILSADIHGTCFLKQKEQNLKKKTKDTEKDQNQWMFEIRGKDEKGNPYYSIRNTGTKARMNFKGNGEILLCQKGDWYYDRFREEERDLWYVWGGDRH